MLYGVAAAAASVNGRPLTLGETLGGQFVRLDGTEGVTVEFQLSV